jgi:hypothetical protein
MKDVAAAIYTKLASVTSAGSFHALVGGRYYLMEAPQNTGFPLSVYSIGGMDNEDQFSGSRVLRGSLSFDIYCEAKTGAAVVMDIEEALFNLLDQQTLTVSGSTYGSVTLQCLARGLPAASDEFIVVSPAFSLFTTRIA